MMQSSAPRFLLLALLLPFQINAFAVTSTHSATTALYSSTIYSDFDNARPHPSPFQQESSIQEDLTKYTQPVTTPRQSAHLQAMDLPRHGPSASEKETAKMLESLEAMIGRVAMLAALVLMTTELTTGMSLPEQLSKLYS